MIGAHETQENTFFHVNV